MPTGWIKLHRQFTQWEWYDDSQMFHLFVHLVLSANHEDKVWRGVMVKRGQLITGLHSLNEATGISIRSIRTCLARLVETGEIDKQSDNRYTVITIRKYEEYQEQPSQSDKQNDKPAASDRQANDNKQELKNKTSCPKTKFSDADMVFALHMKEAVQRVGYNVKDGTDKKWANTIRLMREIDKVDHRTMKEVFDWANHDDFWSMNIRSADTFRKQFQHLKVRQQRKPSNQRKKTHEELVREFGVA